MAGQRSVRERPWPSLRTVPPWLGLVLALVTLFAPALPNSAAARADAVPAGAEAPIRPGAAQAIRQTGPDVHAVARSAERRLAAAVAGSKDDDAGEGPHDVQRVRQPPATPGLVSRAVLPDPCAAGDPPHTGAGSRRTVADETPPDSVFRCNPDGRGPPRRS
ncbi:hypothetical protein O7635_24200 [Asanoa sp. WMMD1127]|uniref:hypothetical protein n=1 Tax=Asanoa sp. WMMD1127 TaxID=3016107 RepID=UPI002415CD40|nr:hypothetical protein [Asanoa sp. WMMD1127]MDG4824962.1 hypothetical protein [Asanoa sp. WMMD1127]